MCQHIYQHMCQHTYQHTCRWMCLIIHVSTHVGMHVSTHVSAYANTHVSAHVGMLDNIQVQRPCRPRLRGTWGHPYRPRILAGTYPKRCCVHVYGVSGMCLCMHTRTSVEGSSIPAENLGRHIQESQDLLKQCLEQCFPAVETDDM